MWSQDGKSSDNSGSKLESKKSIITAKFINGFNIKLKYYWPRHRISQNITSEDTQA